MKFIIKLGLYDDESLLKDQVIFTCAELWRASRFWQIAVKLGEIISILMEIR